MDRNKKKRSASKNVVQNLVIKINGIVDDESKRHEVVRMMKTIEVKMSSIEKLNDAILDEIEEDQMENDIELATLFEIDILKELDKVKEKLSAKVEVKPEPVTQDAQNSVPVANPSAEDAPPAPTSEAVKEEPVSEANAQSIGSTVTQPVAERSASKYSVKLPKIEIKKFNGDTLAAVC